MIQGRRCTEELVFIHGTHGLQNKHFASKLILLLLNENNKTIYSFQALHSTQFLGYMKLTSLCMHTKTYTLNLEHPNFLSNKVWVA